jgi:hypothetical protein
MLPVCAWRVAHVLFIPVVPPDGFGDLTGKVVIFRPGVYPDDFDVPTEHPFFVDSGFGARGNGKIFGTWLDGSERGWGRREWVERVIEPDELAPEQRERLPD